MPAQQAETAGRKHNTTKRLRSKRKETMAKKYDDPLLNEREKTHGNYAETAYYTQWLRDTLRYHSNWHKLSTSQRDALDNIALKLARIVVGDANFDGHWEDVIGYAKLGRTNKNVPEVGTVPGGHGISFIPKVFKFYFVEPTSPTYEEVSIAVNQLRGIITPAKAQAAFADHSAQRVADLSEEEYPAFLRSLYAVIRQEGHAVQVNPKCEVEQHSDLMVCKLCGILYGTNDSNPPTCPKTKALCPENGMS